MRYLRPPYLPLFGDKIFCPGDTGDRGRIVDLATKETINKGCIHVYCVGDELFTVHPLHLNHNSLEKAVLRWHQTGRGSKPVVSSQLETEEEISAPFTLYAMYGDRLVVANGCHRDTSLLKVIPLKNDLTGFRYVFEDGFCIREIFYDDWMKKSPNRSAFHLIESRFVPLYLRKHIDDNTDEVKLVVFDLEKGKPHWEGDANREPSTMRLASDIMRYKSDYVIYFPSEPSGANDEPLLLILDGNTGSLRGAVNILYGNENALDYFKIHIKPEHLKSGRFYFYHNDAAWAMDLRSLELVFRTSEKVRIVDARDKAESILGSWP